MKVADETDHLNMCMREKAALSLAGVDTKEDFEAARADDNLGFPKKVSSKIIRKVPGFQTPIATKDNQNESNAATRDVQCFTVEARDARHSL